MWSGISHAFIGIFDFFNATVRFDSDDKHPQRLSLVTVRQTQCSYELLTANAGGAMIHAVN